MAARSDMLGGFHFNDRRYADDDLTLGSIDPYQVFRIFHEILYFEWETGKRADIAYMIDQSHNLKGKIEAMIQTVTTAQELFAKAALVDHDEARRLPATVRTWWTRRPVCKDAFSTDVRPAIAEWAQFARPARRSDGRVPPERISRTHHGGAEPEGFNHRFKLRVRNLSQQCRSSPQDGRLAMQVASFACAIQIVLEIVQLVCAFADIADVPV